MKNRVRILLSAAAVIGAMNLSTAQVSRTDPNRTNQTTTDQTGKSQGKMDQMDQNATNQNSSDQNATSQDRNKQSAMSQNNGQNTTGQKASSKTTTTKSKTTKSKTSQNKAVKNRASSGVYQSELNRNTLRLTREDINMMIPNLDTWPESSRMAAQEITDKYGKPDAVGPDMIAWTDKAPWKSIHIDRMETRHDFPIAHTDMLKQTINYRVPLDKFNDLAQFDGSIIVDRTQGTMSARCDKEANNLLALNLANDIVTGKKTVDEARKAYGDMVKEKMNGGNPEYMQRLTFTPQVNTAGPDVNTTGMSKHDMPNSTKSKE